jgi:putative phage-type endonuclease
VTAATIETVRLTDGNRGPLLKPGGSDWLRHITASKIAAIIGLSPWESRFSLWHRMMGQLGPVDETPVMTRGRYLEPAVRAWFRDRHPDWQWCTDGPATWVSADEPRFAASPDDEAHDVDGLPVVCEYKSDLDGWQWGEQGTDEIPVHYRAQGMWQMLCTGRPRCHYAVIDGNLEFRAYQLDCTPDEAHLLVDAAYRFCTDLDQANRPDIDDADATYHAIRQLHPLIDGSDIDLDTELVAEFITAKNTAKEATARATGATARVADAMGTAKRAMWDGQVIARRQNRGDSDPYVVAARHLPDPPDLNTQHQGAPSHEQF